MPIMVTVLADRTLTLYTSSADRHAPTTDCCACRRTANHEDNESTRQNRLPGKPTPPRAVSRRQGSEAPLLIGSRGTYSSHSSRRAHTLPFATATSQKPDERTCRRHVPFFLRHLSQRGSLPCARCLWPSCCECFLCSSPAVNFALGQEHTSSLMA
jgi:hypothetical protein